MLNVRIPLFSFDGPNNVVNFVLGNNTFHFDVFYVIISVLNYGFAIPLVENRPFV